MLLWLQVISPAFLAGEAEASAAYAAWAPLISALAADKPLVTKRPSIRDTLINPIKYSLHSFASLDGQLVRGHLHAPLLPCRVCLQLHPNARHFCVRST